MLNVVLAQNLDFTAEVIIGTLDQLESTLLLMLLQVLPYHSKAALIVTLDYLQKTPLVVGG